MDEAIQVEAVAEEKTHVGKVNFPLSVPDGLVDWLQFPDDLVHYAPEMGLDHRTVKFILASTNGRWALGATVDLQQMAIRTGMQYSEMDRIIADLLEKNYARLGERLELYRLWIVLLHLKGVRFDVK